jgi:hypothetical protein
MKNLTKLNPKPSETNQETDIEDSLFVILRKKGKAGQKGGKGARKGRRQVQKLKRTAYPLVRCRLGRK